MATAAAVAAAPQFVIFPVLAVGIVLSIVELIFVHADERGLGWLRHGLHAIPVMLIFIFVSMNVGYVLSLVGFSENVWIEVAVRVVVGLIAMAKIAGAAAIAGKVGEKKFHVLIIGALVMISPYLWEWFLKSLTEQYVPWLAK
ncbi:MAG TPA: hypothetical protein VJG90_08735 [Candidatus Nanoarchaeia archaeon]|nr:hypothetical protein [Candidatus Nanoarchaeia archaeon]